MIRSLMKTNKNDNEIHITERKIAQNEDELCVFEGIVNRIGGV